ncbi:hypothetical protein ASPCADRAFT_203722 [Aspergillus carbonarius ITEM 5010]|uniref:Uncharacterized protein n=1 Tax=Aspergillus carbonarius (strain ITEM 5010) TaxID=602072 RepID=A0A1R3RZI0_ASPC5|nr:hypothetical protein ASPCADRAFT_203722 [Aspergillus carbonarius ITEM 5010]
MALKLEGSASTSAPECQLQDDIPWPKLGAKHRTVPNNGWCSHVHPSADCTLQKCRQA